MNRLLLLILILILSADQLHSKAPSFQQAWDHGFKLIESPNKLIIEGKPIQAAQNLEQTYTNIITKFKELKESVPTGFPLLAIRGVVQQQIDFNRVFSCEQLTDQMKNYVRFVTYFLGKNSFIVDQKTKTSLATITIAGEPIIALAKALNMPGPIIDLLLAHGAPKEALEHANETALRIAAYCGDINAVSVLIQKVKNIDSKNSVGMTALALATLKNNNQTIIQVLIQNGSNVNSTDAKNNTPLMWAIAGGLDYLSTVLMTFEFPSVIQQPQGQLHAVRYLIQHGADVQPQNKNRDTTLKLAFKAKNGLPIIKYLVQNGASLAATSQFGQTVLMDALSASASPEIIDYLIAQGVDVNATNKAGVTALMLALSSLDKKVAPALIELLLNKGANINAKTKDGQTVFEKAVQSGTLPVIELLVKHGAPIKGMPLKNALLNHTPDRLAIINYLLTGGAIIDQDDLAPAAQYAGLPEVQLLIEHGASINQQDKKGRTPLMLAVQNGKHGQQIMQYLVSKGANVEQKDHQGNTALYYAAQSGTVDLIRYLLQSGASLATTNNKDETVLMATLRDMAHGVDKIQYLIKKGVDVNAQDSDGNTAIMRVISFPIVSYEPIFDALIMQPNIDLAIKNKQGKTALDIALEKKEAAQKKLATDKTKKYANAQIKNHDIDYDTQQIAFLDKIVQILNGKLGPTKKFT